MFLQHRGAHADILSRRLLAILAEAITKQFLGTLTFVIIFVIITKIIPPEHFLCNVAATGLSRFASEHAKICFVKRLFCNFYKISNSAKTFLVFFVIVLAADCLFTSINVKSTPIFAY